ncbi:hypothetical protein BN8_04232 [Fibrisoma limi BUZ 3]|uniref:Transposase IS200-like domain-containing protein n=1 Tax=Fibrisoma limi BUZ 3 TaxID=1185876 RepID=I2GM76_9BACT|nr:transposase [Fibrisoma limi]CCH55003.1 hypothetical protein BN8_04232 [Fibrisoma limi BUZ 3]
MNNYIAFYVHLVWTTKYREPVLHKDVRYPLFEHISYIFNQEQHHAVHALDDEMKKIALYAN